MSQKELAEKLNIARQSISKWEQDSSLPSIIYLKALSNVLNISIDELLKEL